MKTRVATINDIRIASGQVDLYGYNDKRVHGRSIKVYPQIPLPLHHQTECSLNKRFAGTYTVTVQKWYDSTVIHFKDIKQPLPDYLTPEQADTVVRILNQTRSDIVKMFTNDHIMKHNIVPTSDILRDVEGAYEDLLDRVVALAYQPL